MVHTSNVILRDLPQEERPRERMLVHGAQSLSSAELLAILLRTGSKSESVIRLSERLLAESGGLRGMADMTHERFTGMKGIGPAKALLIQAGIELGRRLARSVKDEAVIVRSPRDAADYIREDLRYLTKEHFVCLFLNTKNHIIAQETLSMGSLNASIVHPREVFRAAIQRGSASIICAHNHPSGDPTPSKEDVELTNRLVEAGNIIGIEVLDHLVIGESEYVSLKERGLM